MAIEQASFFCLRCRQPRLFTRQGTNHILHLIVTLFLCGLWIPVWILIAIADGNKAYYCQQCGYAGSPSALANPRKTQQMIAQAAAKRLESTWWEKFQTSPTYNWAIQPKSTWKVATIGLGIFMLSAGVTISLLFVLKTSIPISQPATSKIPSANQNASTTALKSFGTDVICSLPKQVAPNTPFANLGGGNWGKWNDSNGELDYGCNGGNGSIKLKGDGNVDITAEYGAIGGAQNVHYASAEYTAFQYTGQTLAEKQLRKQYADFCDRLSEKFYGQKLPEKFRKRLLDESTYSPSGTANDYGEKVGNGYVSLSSNKNKTVIILDVGFYSSEDEYKNYKDS